MKIAVASGKGGTGKTTLSVNMALSAGRDLCLLDCDVEEPNAHIFLKPELLGERKSVVLVPEIDFGKCVWCGKCADVCAYNAIVIVPPSGERSGTGFVFEHLCHSCGACAYFCPTGAISEKGKEIGKVEFGRRGKIKLVSGRLNVGEITAVPLIKEVKRSAESSLDAIIDAPPGTSCPMIESVRDSDYVILVTEPTPFGLNDLILAVEVVRKLSIPFGVVINRADYGGREVAEYCRRENIALLAEIPFRREFAEAYSEGIPLLEKYPESGMIFREIFLKAEKGAGK